MFELLERDAPRWVIGSPPCTSFSLWNTALNYKTMDPAKVRRMRAEGMVHLTFAASVYRYQLERGRYFLHEHPQSAASWAEDPIRGLLQNPSVGYVDGDQCEYGLTSPTSDGGNLPARKTTGFMSNSMYMLRQLAKRCTGGHVHQQLVGGRAKAAEIYPLKLVEAMLRGIRDTDDHDMLTEESAQQAELVRESMNLCIPMNAVAGPQPKDDIV